MSTAEDVSKFNQKFMELLRQTNMDEEIAVMMYIHALPPIYYTKMDEYNSLTDTFDAALRLEAKLKHAASLAKAAQVIEQVNLHNDVTVNDSATHQENTDSTTELKCFHCGFLSKTYNGMRSHLKFNHNKSLI